MTAQEIDIASPATPSPSGAAAPPSAGIPTQSMAFSDWVFSLDPEWVRLYRQLEAEGRIEEIEAHYVPRTLRLYAGYNKGPVVDEMDLPPDGLDEEELEGILAQNGWPARRLQAKVSRGWRYLKSRSFAADPKAAPGPDGDHADADADTLEPRTFLAQLGAVIASEHGPAYLEQLVRVVGPAVVETHALWVKRTTAARLEAEAEYRRQQQEQLEAQPHLAYQQRPINQY